MSPNPLDLTAEDRIRGLAEASRRKGGNANLGRLLGHRDGSFVGQLLRGERAINEKLIAAVCQIDGLADVFSPKGTATAYKLPNQNTNAQSLRASEPSTDWPPKFANADALHVPLLANSASMGAGDDTLHEDVVVGTLSLSQQWLRRHFRPTSVGALRFIHAYGDSMTPTFSDGDVLLVDTGARDPSDIDGVYVLNAHNRLFVKRVRKRLDGQLEVSSDNPSVKTVDELNGDMSLPVIGRVIWVWKGVRL